MSKDSCQGYLRADGSVGVRNLIAVVPSSGCAQHAASRIASLEDGAVLLNYTGGCGETMAISPGDRTAGTVCPSPEHHRYLVVSLGCETLNAHRLAELAGGGWAQVELLTIAGTLGGTAKP